MSALFLAVSCAANSNGSLSASSGASSSGVSSTGANESGSQGGFPGAAYDAAGPQGLFVADASLASSSLVDVAEPDGFVGCAATTVQAKLLPLDLYFMLDTSLSMDDLVAPTTSKWQAVTAAINTFVNDPASAGLGVGVQHFPLTAQGVPASCTSSAQCGAAGPCFLKVCALPVAEVVPCDTDTDCTASSGRRSVVYSCVAAGQCANAHDVICAPGAACGNDANGFDLGNCEAITSSFCLGNDDCAAPDYQVPGVAIAPLPGNAAPITSWLSAHQPLGNTPTQAAMQGAISGAEAFASSHLGHTVVVVLATDGQPDEIADAMGQCASPASAQAAAQGVAQVVAAGLAATPSIKTFGIGVFTPSDLAPGTAALDTIAAAGGTGQPFIIGTSGNATVEQEFTAALTAIRGASLPCSYSVPTPAAGNPDFSKINVQVTSGSGAASTIPYVESPGNCDPTVGGWYYNVDPAEGGVPTTIGMCPVSCSTLKADTTGRVDIVLGCKTETIIR
jgi:hypothetical protein